MADLLSGLAASLPGAVSQGIIYGVMVLGVYITFRLLDIADLTADGSFALGGCSCAMLIAGGVNPVLATIGGLVTGALSGTVTGILHTVFEIPAILAGILTMTALWSIDLRIMAGKSNLSINKMDSLVTFWTDRFHLTQAQASLIVGAIVVLAVIGILYWFFGTELGSAMRATGDNEDMIRALGANTKVMKLLALTLSNALIGLSGALFAQSQKYGDVGMGTGTIVIGLAAIVIGEVLFGRFRNFAAKLSAAVMGSICYFIIRAVVLRMGMKANDMKLLSAIIVALSLCIPVVIQKYKAAKAYQESDAEEETC